MKVLFPPVEQYQFTLRDIARKEDTRERCKVPIVTREPEDHFFL